MSHVRDSIITGDKIIRLGRGSPYANIRQGLSWYNHCVPRISEFFGIVIKLYYNDHSPAHFHAEYGEFEAIYTIETIEVLRGELPRRAHAMVLEWTALHRMELKDNWEMARQGLPLRSVAPLD